jgi:hypothetical protein
VSNYLLDLVRRGAGLAPAVAPEPSLQPDFGPLLPMDAIPGSIGMLPAEEAHSDAPIPTVTTRTPVETPAQPMPEPGADPLASGGETAPLPLASADTATATPNTLSQHPTVSESDSVRGAGLAENTPPPKPSSEDAPSVSPETSGTEPTPQRHQPPARHHQPEPPGEGASIRGSVDPGVISPEGDTRGPPTQAGPPNVASPAENLPPASLRQRHRQPEPPGDAVLTREPADPDTVSPGDETRGGAAETASPKVASPAESLQARVKTGVHENRSPEQGMVETPPPEDAPMASRGTIAPNPEATITTRPRVTRDSVESPAPRSPAIITHTTAAPPRARVSDPDRGAPDAEDPDRSEHALPEALPPGRLGRHTTQLEGGEPEGSRNRSFSPTGEEAARTSTRQTPSPVQGQPELSRQGNEPQNLRNVPVRSYAVPRPVEDGVAPAVDTLAGSTVLAAREEPASSRSRSQTIQVHIGKVEVRAATPSPAAPPAPQAPKPQGFEGYELVRSYLSWERH